MTKPDPSVPGYWRASGLGGWVIVVKAQRARDALRYARAVASGASLLPTDVQSVTPATEADIDWYRSMGGDPA